MLVGDVYSSAPVSAAAAPVGTLYWAVYPAAQAAPTAVSVITQTVPNGFFATSALTGAEELAHASPTITGLSSSTEYRVAAVFYNAATVSNLVISELFTTETGVVVLTLDSIQQPKLLDNATISVGFTAGLEDLLQSSDLTSVNILAEYIVIADSTEQQTAIDNATVDVKYSISSEPILNSSILNTITLLAKFGLSAQRSAQSNILNNTLLQQTGSLSPEKAEQLQNTDIISLLAKYNITKDSISQAQSLDGSNISAKYSALINKVNQNNLLKELNIDSGFVLLPSSVRSEQLIASMLLTQKGFLATNYFNQNSLLGFLSLTQKHNLPINDLFSFTDLDSTTLDTILFVNADGTTQETYLSLASLEEIKHLESQKLSLSHSLENIATIANNSFILDNFTLNQTVKGLQLIQNHYLSVFSSSQDNILSQAELNWILPPIYFNNVIMGQSSDTVDLTQHHLIDVRNLSSEQLFNVLALGGFMLGSLDGKIVIYALYNGTVS